MLESAPTIAFLATTDVERARGFHEGVLGLRLVTNERQTLVFDCSRTMLRISEFESFQPQAFTVLGWVVDDIESTMTRLAERGVEFERYEGLGQNERGDSHLCGWCQSGLGSGP